MKFTTTLMDIIAVRRLTRLVLEDKITEDLRNLIFDKFNPRTTKLGYLLTCPWCVSIWAGAVIFGLRKVSPHTADVVSGLLAASYATGIAAERGY